MKFYEKVVFFYKIVEILPPSIQIAGLLAPPEEIFTNGISLPSDDVPMLSYVTKESRRP